MQGTLAKLLATGLMACGLFACSTPDLADLPVRDAPQAEVPYSPETSGQPLRGTAVAVDVAQ